MRTILRVFMKDVRRLWKEIAITLILLGDLTWLDRWRADSTPGSVEGWLNLLLPFAWAYLIARVVHEDPLVGDRQFWVTMPVQWGSHIAAKALFVVAFIHLPDIAADATILAVRGFRPSALIAALFGKQLLLIAALTLPSVAIATLVRNTAQFMLSAIVTAAGVVFVNGGFALISPPWTPSDQGRLDLALAILATTSLSVVVLQFARRWTKLARSIAIGAALVTAMLYAWLPVESTAAVRCALSPGNSASGAMSVHLSSQEAQSKPFVTPRGSQVVSVPIEISVTQDDVGRIFRLLTLGIEGSDGRRYSATPLSSPKTSVFAWLDPSRTGLVIEMNSKTYDAVKNAPVKIRGAILAEFFRGESPTRIPVGVTADVPGLGRCSSMIVDARLGEQLLKVDCESVSEIPFMNQVRLLDRATGWQWIGNLGASMTNVSYPRMTWLSPLNHRDAFFHLTLPGIGVSQRSGWVVPSDVLDHADLEISPRRPAGCAVFSYELPEISLSQFAVEPRR